MDGAPAMRQCRLISDYLEATPHLETGTGPRNPFRFVKKIITDKRQPVNSICFNCSGKHEGGAENGSFYCAVFEIALAFVNWHFTRSNSEIKSLFKDPKKTAITLCHSIMPFHTL